MSLLRAICNATPLRLWHVGQQMLGPRHFPLKLTGQMPIDEPQRPIRANAFQAASTSRAAGNAEVVLPAISATSVLPIIIPWLG